MDSRMFDGLIFQVLLIGAAMGLAIAAIIGGLWWIFNHVVVRWV